MISQIRSQTKQVKILHMLIAQVHKSVVSVNEKSIPNNLYSLPVIDLVCLTCLRQNMANIILKEVAKIVIVVVTSRYWQS